MGRAVCTRTRATNRGTLPPPLPQQLWGVVQGAQYEDLHRRAARTLAQMEVDGQRFDGFGVGGALEKRKPRHHCFLGV